jgi:hypothetical protein
MRIRAKTPVPLALTSALLLSAAAPLGAQAPIGSQAPNLSFTLFNTMGMRETHTLEEYENKIVLAFYFTPW